MQAHMYTVSRLSLNSGQWTTADTVDSGSLGVATDPEDSELSLNCGRGAAAEAVNSRLSLNHGCQVAVDTE